MYRLDNRLGSQHIEIRLNRNVPEGAFTSAFTTANALGMIPGHGADLSLVPGPSIMGDDALGVTAKDRLHTKILYKRPIGSVTPDTDPAGATIN